VRHQVPCLYKIAGEIVVLCKLIFIFFGYQSEMQKILKYLAHTLIFIHPKGGPTLQNKNQGHNGEF